MAADALAFALDSPVLHGTDASLWLVPLDVTVGFDLVTATLSAVEQARAARFRFERDARRYRVSHVALRQVLSHHMGIAAQALNFVEGPFGKPRLDHRAAPHFNMSHSADWALIGICADAPIGVDIEVPHDMDDLDALAQRNFTPAEFKALQKVAHAQQLHAFLRCWTRKEACLKALGSGLSIEPGVFEAGIEAAPRSTAIPVEGQACRMTVVSLALPFQGLAAWARMADTDHHLAM